MNPAELPDRFHVLLDERHDPLDEPEVQSWLLQHPDRLEAFARWRAMLGTVPGSQPLPLPGPARPPVLLPLAIAAAAVAFAIVSARLSRPVADPPWPRPDFAVAGRVVAFSTCTAVAGSSDEGATQATWSSSTHTGRVAAHRAATLSCASEPSPSVPVCVMVVRAEENQPSCLRP
jgi:hypothetical protein